MFKWIAAFFGARLDLHRDAAFEVAISLLIATSPITLGSFINVSTKGNETGYLQHAYYLISRGEVFAYCMGIIGAIFWICNREWFVEHHLGANRFPLKMLFNLYCLLTSFISIVMWGIDFVRVELEPRVIVPISLVLFAISSFIYYVILVLKSIPPPDIEKDNARKSEDLSSRLSALKLGAGNGP